jgi:hypothetical protein
MTTWTNDELERIRAEEEMEIAPRRGDDTLRRPVTIWVVRVGDDLYVRSVNGRTSSWFRAARVRHEGHIAAGGVEKDVTYVEVESNQNLKDQIDAAYCNKYRRYAGSIVNTTLTTHAQAATLKLVPRAGL